MNWFLLGGGALIVFWLAGRRVAKRDAATPEPIFATGDGAGSAGAGGAPYYGGGGGGDAGLSLVGPALAPIGSDIKANASESGSLMDFFVESIGFKPIEKTDEIPMRQIGAIVPMDDLDLPSSAAPRSLQIPSSPSRTSGIGKMIESIGKISLLSVAPSLAQVAAATSNSTSMGSSSLSMSSLPSTVNNDRAVSSAVQAQPPRSFSSVSASISEKNMMPTIYAKPAVTVSKPAVAVAAPMPVKESFVAAIRPVPLALSPATRLANAVRR